MPFDPADYTACVGAWTMDTADISGTSMTDKSGNSNTGTLVGSPTSVLGKIAQALSFDGSSQYVKALSFPYSDAVSSCAWVKDLQAGNTSYRTIVGHQTSRSGVGDWFLYWYPPDSKIHVDIPYVLADAVVSDLTVTDLATTWHHICFTRTGSSGSWTYKIYIDGSLHGTNTISTNPTTGAQTLFFAAADNSADHYSRGLFDDIRIYNRGLSSTDIAALAAWTGGSAKRRIAARGLLSPLGNSGRGILTPLGV